MTDEKGAAEKLASKLGYFFNTEGQIVPYTSEAISGAISRVGFVGRLWAEAVRLLELNDSLTSARHKKRQ